MSVRCAELVAPSPPAQRRKAATPQRRTAAHDEHACAAEAPAAASAACAAEAPPAAGAACAAGAPPAAGGARSPLGWSILITAALRWIGGGGGRFSFMRFQPQTLAAPNLGRLLARARGQPPALCRAPRRCSGAARGPREVDACQRAASPESGARTRARARARARRRRPPAAGRRPRGIAHRAPPRRARAPPRAPPPPRRASAVAAPSRGTFQGHFGS